MAIVDDLMALLPPKRPPPITWVAWVCPRGGISKRYEVRARSAPMARLRVMRAAQAAFPQGYTFSVRKS
jgi:hypothetical protein